MAVTKRRSQHTTDQAKPSAARTERYPVERPSFTLKDVRAAVPPHCFEKSTLRGLSYLARDVLIVGLLWYASTWIDHPAVPRWLSFVLWPTYWYWQGAVATGLWVIGHECGHGAISNTKVVNDAVGLVVHSLLLVPYFSWKHSHRRHHQHCCSTELDEVFVPVVKAPGSKGSWLQHTFLGRVARLFVQQLLGWPTYLFVNVTGRPYDRWANHFNPYSPIFTKKERIQVLVSDIALAGVLSGLGVLGRAFGWVWLLKTYGIPYLVVNHWLVMATFLQHTHPALPHYGEGEWDWLRGALGTVDRSYGKILNVLFHHAVDTHVAHHLFSGIPHYHAQEATAAVKQVLGPYYAKDDRNVFRALWEEIKTCGHVEPDTGGPEKVYWYH